MNTAFPFSHLSLSSLPLTVGQLNLAISGLLEKDLASVRVRGEVSNFTCAVSGHWYFSLKDDDAQIRCVMFRRRNQNLDFLPREGQALELVGSVSLYSPRGELQLSVEMAHGLGAGDLFVAFQQLKNKLAALGLFDAARKRPLPPQPKAVGVITSLQAAALRDVLAVFARRAPHLRVIIYPAPVQGNDAAAKLAAMIDLANTRAEIDVLILCRGGGSIEDLWAFNEEVLAQAIARSRLPVVVGVGHETDFTIADFVADLRAPTPTAAAEMASFDRQFLLQRVWQVAHNLQRGWRRHTENQAQRLDALARRLLHPRLRLRESQRFVEQAKGTLAYALRLLLARTRAQIAQHRARLLASRPQQDVLRLRLNAVVTRLRQAHFQQYELAQNRLRTIEAALALLNPHRILERGYAVLLDKHGQAIRSPNQLLVGCELAVHLEKGNATIVLAKVIEG